MKPYERLERFEEKYGDWDTLVNKYMEAKYDNNPNETEAKKIDRLLKQYNRLLWYAMGYERGLIDVERKSHESK